MPSVIATSAPSTPASNRRVPAVSGVSAVVSCTCTPDACEPTLFPLADGGYVEADVGQERRDLVLPERQRTRRLDEDPRAAEPLHVDVGGDFVRLGCSLHPRRRDDRAALEIKRHLPAGRPGVERDVVDADAGLLDRAVVVGPD